MFRAPLAFLGANRFRVGFAALLILAFPSIPADVEPVRMVADLNPWVGSQEATPQDFVAFDGQVYFSAKSRNNGRELWKTDGTPEGTLLARDFNSTPWLKESSDVEVIGAAGGRLLLSADDGIVGRRAWITDGTPRGAVRIDAIRDAGPYSNLVEAGGLVFFAADDGRNGVELWKTDGTAEGTGLVKDIRPGPESPWMFGPFQGGAELLVFDDQVFFAADDGIHGWELWRSDGTEAGTRMVRDIWPGGFGSLPSRFVIPVGGGTLIFVAAHPDHGFELWRSDGTPDGTVLVKDIRPGPDSGIWGFLSGPVDGSVYFWADDGIHGREPWTSDGTSEGTRLVQDIRPGPESSGSGPITVLGDRLLFPADDGITGRELRSLDPGSGVISLVLDIRPGPEGSSTGGLGISKPLSVVGSTAFFTARDGIHGGELWRTDGTPEGTRLVRDIRPGSQGSGPQSPVISGDQLFFIANDGTRGWTFWRSDGSEKGTYALFGEMEDPGLSREVTALNGGLLFQADDPTIGESLWFSDGTPKGTKVLKDIGRIAGGSSSFLTASRSPVRSPDRIEFNGALVFRSSNFTFSGELWRSDGTESGTRMIRDIRPGPFGSNPDQFTLLNGEIFFGASDGIAGGELWKSDGTEAGTMLVKDIHPGPASGSQSSFSFRGLKRFGNGFFFRADDGVHGVELWKSDGTEAGTEMVKDIRVGPANSWPIYPVRVGDTFFFNAFDEVHGRELRKTDGTEQGTSLVKDILPGVNCCGPFMTQEMVSGATLFMNADDGLHGRELWKTDGTEAGTVLVKDINVGSNDSVKRMSGQAGVVFRNRLLFAADDGIHGRELWVSDGTEAGTLMVKDIRSGAGGSIHRFRADTFIALEDGILFSADDGVHGWELWRSDGTEEGTVLVSDIWTGADGSDPWGLSRFGRFVLFQANDGLTGLEPWVSDGTARGTYLIQDIAPGLLSSEPRDYIRAGNRIFFTADDHEHGRELWVTKHPAVVGKRRPRGAVRLAP